MVRAGADGEPIAPTEETNQGHLILPSGSKRGRSGAADVSPPQKRQCRLTVAPALLPPAGSPDLVPALAARKRRRGLVQCAPSMDLDCSSTPSSPAPARALDMVLWYEVGGWLPVHDALVFGTTLKHWKSTSHRFQEYKHALRERRELDMRGVRLEAVGLFVREYLQNGMEEILLPAVRKIVFPSCAWLVNPFAIAAVFSCPHLQSLHAVSCGPWKERYDGRDALVGTVARDELLPKQPACCPPLFRWRQVQWRHIGFFCKEIQGIHLEECSHLSNTEVYAFRVHLKNLRSLSLPRPQLFTRQFFAYLPPTIRSLHVNLLQGENGRIESVPGWPADLANLRVSGLTGTDFASLCGACSGLRSLEVDNAALPTATLNMEEVPPTLRSLKLHGCFVYNLTRAMSAGLLADLTSLSLVRCRAMPEDCFGADATFEGVLKFIQESCPKLEKLELQMEYAGFEDTLCIKFKLHAPRSRVRGRRPSAEAAELWELQQPLSRYSNFCSG
eukprot:TRINITY_DN5886_c1_g1_i2.p1 TRINITY_DN5886_c1_g1~~TRINITY_DN5886_c1_g1_i2.p1  ORF type:complete len:522 (+),score=127.07 TRINITY_DN5886_c1_g1_i2:61-1566(+)